MAKILIIEDEPSMQLGLRDNLEMEGYQVNCASDGEAGLSHIRSNQYDLVLLDVMLPKLSGFDVCKAARGAGINTPIILLTARGEEIDKVLGLELGADDYITKPFSVRELLARVKAILRRNQPVTQHNETIVFIGKLRINFQTLQAQNEQQDIKLSHKEFEILQYLYNNRNKPVTRYELLEKVWGYGEHITTRTVDNFIARLRQKIEVNQDQPKVIITVHGAGYKLVAE